MANRLVSDWLASDWLESVGSGQGTRVGVRRVGVRNVRMRLRQSMVNSGWLLNGNASSLMVLTVVEKGAVALSVEVTERRHWVLADGGGGAKAEEGREAWA